MYVSKKWQTVVGVAVSSPVFYLVPGVAKISVDGHQPGEKAFIGAVESVGPSVPHGWYGMGGVSTQTFSEGEALPRWRRALL